MPDKISKAAVHYQNQPHGHEQCSRCTMFVRPRGCTLVMGEILPQGWCIEYDAKNLGTKSEAA